MARSGTKAAAALAAAFLLTIGSATSAMAAQAAEEPPPSEAPDRIIYIDHPAPRPDEGKLIPLGGDVYEAFVATEAEFPLIPAPGETVRIIYTDAVTEVATEPRVEGARAASCTRAITVNTPTLSSNRPRVYGAGMITSGCTSGSTYRLFLYNGLFVPADGSVYVPNNGSSFGISIVGGTCWSNSIGGFRGFGRFGGSGGSWGPSTNLACSY